MNAIIGRWFLWCCFALCVLSGAASALAADDSWLVGTWELKYDPDGSPKDWMEFNAGGEAFRVAPNGKRVPGSYTVTPTEVHIVYKIKDKQIPLTLKVSADKKQLLAPSSKSGKSSVYEKK